MKNIKKQDVMFALVFLLLVILQIWKATIGLGEPDEHYYTVLGQRLFLGESLFVDEWNISQLMAVFLYPLLWVFETLTHSTDGIVLYVRYMYVLFSSIVGVVIYFRFRCKGIRAILSASIYMLFVPFNIMSLSYNTMSVGFLILACCLWPTENDSHIKIRSFFVGVFYGFAVVNTPYLALLYFIGFVIYAWTQKGCFTWSRPCFTTMGIIVAAVFTITIILRNTTINQVLASLSHIVDPSHSNGVIRQFVISGGKLVRDFQLFILLFIIVLLYALISKKAKKNPEYVLEIASAITIMAMIWICFIQKQDSEIGEYSLLLIPVTWFGILLLILKRNSIDKDLIYFFLISVFHAVMISISSNVGPRAFSGPLIWASSITILLCGQIEWTTKQMKLADRGMIAVMFLVLLYFKCCCIYGPTKVSECNKKIENGPLKGLLDTEYNVLRYQEYLEDIEIINQLPGGYVNLISNQTWLYLASTKPYCTNSSYMYLWEKEQYTETMDLYYEVHPTLRPVYIYLDQWNQYQMTEEDPWLREATELSQGNYGTILRKD